MHYVFLNPFTTAEVLSLKAEHLKWTQVFKKMDTYSRKYWCVVYEIIRLFFFQLAWLFLEQKWQGGFPLHRNVWLNWNQAVLQVSGFLWQSSHPQPFLQRLISFDSYKWPPEPNWRMCILLPCVERIRGICRTQQCELLVCFCINSVLSVMIASVSNTFWDL